MSEDNAFTSSYLMKIYKEIENDFIDYIRYVPLDPEFKEAHLRVCSPILADLLLRICSQIEIYFKEWVKLPEFDGETDSDLVRGLRKNSKGKVIKPRIPVYLNFFDAQKKIKRKKITIYPLEKKVVEPFKCQTDSDVPTWWTVYNKTKHDGFKERSRANLENITYSLAGLFLLHCLNWRNSRKALVENNMTRVTDFGLSKIKNHKIDTLPASEFRTIRTPHYFHSILFEYNDNIVAPN